MLSYTLYCLILLIWRVLLFSPFHWWGQEVCCQRRVGIQTSSDHRLLLLAVYSTSFYYWGSPSGAAVKNLPAMQETWIWYLDQEDPLEKEIATTPVFLPEKSHGQRSLEGYNPFVLIATNYYFIFVYTLTYLLSSEFFVDKNLIIENKVFACHMSAMKDALKDAHFD